MKNDGGDFHKALQYAYLLLRYRDRSESEFIRRLRQKGFADNISSEVVIYLKEHEFIDDSRLAKALRRLATEQKHLGKRGTANYLISRGIPKEIISELLGDDEDYLGTAKVLATRKMRQLANLDGVTAKRRLWGVLARKGFSQDIIRTVLQEHF